MNCFEQLFKYSIFLCRISYLLLLDLFYFLKEYIGTNIMGNKTIHRFSLKLYMAKVDITFENYNGNFVSKVVIAFFIFLLYFVCNEIESNWFPTSCSLPFKVLNHYNAKLTVHFLSLIYDLITTKFSSKGRYLFISYYSPNEIAHQDTVVMSRSELYSI